MGEVKFIDPEIGRIGYHEGKTGVTLWLKELSVTKENVKDVLKAISIFQRMVDE